MRKSFGALALGLSMLGTAHADGGSANFSELAARWWQWALSIPTASNPLPDTTGASCMIGQQGDVWFLAGTSTGTPVQRQCTVPEGVDLFFPVLNTFNANTPGCFQDLNDLTIEELRDSVTPGMDAATGMSVRLDNRPVSFRRESSRPFSIVFPPGPNLFGITCVTPGKIYSPAVDEGYYALVRGLRPGQHTLQILGTTGTFHIDVFYTLNVSKVVLRDRR